jgi:hypothetical protein
MDMANPDRFWTQPDKVPPKQDQPDPIVQAEQIKVQSAEKIRGAELQQRERDAMRDDQTKRYEVDTDAQVKIALSNQQAENQKYLEAFKADAGAGMERVKAELSPKVAENKQRDTALQSQQQFIQQFMQSQQEQTQAIAQMFQQMIQQMQVMNGPKRVIRGKDGRVESVMPLTDTMQ